MSDYTHIDIDKLKNRLYEIKLAAKQLVLIDPTRGLKGELLGKMVAGLAGHRSGNLTKKELKEVEKIQLDYDRLHSSH